MRLRSWTNTSSLLLAAYFFTGAILAVGCAHTPTPEEREQAQGQYGVALSLVHDARRLGTAGTSSEADAKWRQALGELQQAERLDPENGEIQYLLGMVYFVGFRREVETLKHLNRAIQLRATEGYPEAQHLMGTALVEFGRPEEAVPFLDKARQNLLYQTPYFAEQELGWAYFKLERYDEAVRHLEAAIAAQPDLCSAYVRLADVEWALEKADRVDEILGQFIERCDSDRLRSSCGDMLLAYAYYRVGIARMKLGAKDAAREALGVCSERFEKQKVAAECKQSLQILGP